MERGDDNDGDNAASSAELGLLALTLEAKAIDVRIKVTLLSCNITRGDNQCDSEPTVGEIGGVLEDAASHSGPGDGAPRHDSEGGTNAMLAALQVEVVFFTGVCGNALCEANEECEEDCAAELEGYRDRQHLNSGLPPPDQVRATPSRPLP